MTNRSPLNDVWRHTAEPDFPDMQADIARFLDPTEPSAGKPA